MASSISGLSLSICSVSLIKLLKYIFAFSWLRALFAAIAAPYIPLNLFGCPFKSISYAKHARNSLLEAIKLSQGKLKGNIYSTLGYLYLVSPKLSLSLKSKSKEQYYLLKGLQLNPDGLQSNYYYALYLLNKGHGSEIAQEYLIKALNAKQTFLNKDSSELMKKEIQLTINN